MPDGMMEWKVRDFKEEVAPGSIVMDDWEMKKKLGEGGFGNVWMAEKNLLGIMDRSAIKIIRIPRDPADISAMRAEGFSKASIQAELRKNVESAIREIRTMISLRSHPAIVPCESFDVIQYEDDGSWELDIRMQLLTSLTDWAAAGKVKQEDVRRMGISLSDLLSVCEKENILHRDIKPANIFVDKLNNFKLGDFGLARVISEAASTHSKGVGTEAFMAPEVFRSGKYDHRADLYSLGLVMYWLLNNQSLPFTDEKTSRSEAIARRLSGEPLPALSGVDPELDRIIRKACDPNPNKRWNNAQEFHDALQNLSVSSSQRPKKGGWKAAVAVLAVLALLAGGYVLLKNFGSSGPDSHPTDTPTPYITDTPTPDADSENNDNSVADREAKYAPYRTPGSIVTFGRYEQDNNEANGPEEIEWIVLDFDEEEHKALLLSRHGLDAKPYNTKSEAITWEKCSLRNWLNGEFLQSAFSAGEQAAILTTAVDNSASQGYSEWNTDGGNNTQDQIFLLSYAEANCYLNVAYGDSGNVMARIAPTAYAVANGARRSTAYNGIYQTTDGEKAGWWWLRSPGPQQSSTAEVSASGSLNNYRIDMDSEVVRPALWINLESEITPTLASTPTPTPSSVSDADSENNDNSVADREAKYAPYRTPWNTVFFGHYEQDNNEENDPEKIEWIVLDYDEKGHKALLLSRYGLDAKPYNTEAVDTDWEKCTLRSWLNGEFLQAAFSAEERAAILTTAVDNSASQGYSNWNSDGGNNTQDQIFLLSYAEANRYLNVAYGNSANVKGRVAPTPYAAENGAWTSSDCQTTDGKAAGYWWLRSPGYSRSSKALVFCDGAFHNIKVDFDKAVVRPAFWLNLESEITPTLASTPTSIQTPASTPTPTPTPTLTPTSSPAPIVEEKTTEGLDGKTINVMSHEEFVKAELDTAVTIEAYVQANQSWWDGKIKLYMQDENHGGYFVYDMPCTEEEAAKITVPGTKLRISGMKAEWSGEAEIIEAKYEILEGSFIAEPEDVTALFGTEELVNHMNEKIAVKGAKVVGKTIEGEEGVHAFLYAWDGSGSHDSNSDLYFDVEIDRKVYSFTVESYLCDNTTDVYKAVEALKVGDFIDLEGFLYWYNEPNPHITSVTEHKEIMTESVDRETNNVMSHEEFVKAELDSPVTIEAYVQANQSWWDGRIRLYMQDENHGGYFIYDMPCTEEEAAKITVPGTRLRISGMKAEWSGETEIIDATYEILKGAFIAEPEDVTALFGKKELINHMNEKIAVKGAKVIAKTIEGQEGKFAFLYEWDGSGSQDANSDLYFDVEIGGQVYTFTVESYLCNNSTDVYKAVEGLKIGDTIDLEGFLYWYNGVNPLITRVTKHN